MLPEHLSIKNECGGGRNNNSAMGSRMGEREREDEGVGERRIWRLRLADTYTAPS